MRAAAPIPRPVAAAARFIVGADGARSRVARDLGLDVNRRFLVGAEIVHPIASGTTTPAFHCVLDPRVAPGYLGWVIQVGSGKILFTAIGLDADDVLKLNPNDAP